MSFARGPENLKQRWEYYVATVAIVYFAWYYSAIFAGELVQDWNLNTEVWSTKMFAVQLIPFVISLVILLACVRFIHRQPILSVITARKNFSIHRFFLAFGLWFLIQGIFLIISYLSGTTIKLQWEPESFFPLLLVSVIVLPIQTAFEDIFYRGYLFQGLTFSFKKAWLALLVLAFLFGLMHSGNPEVQLLGKGILVYYIFSGLFMGFLAHMDDGLELGMGFHFANNLFGTIILTNDWQVIQTKAIFMDHSEAYFGWGDWLALFTIHPAMVFIFYKVYRWKNPRKKIVE